MAVRGTVLVFNVSGTAMQPLELNVKCTTTQWYCVYLWNNQDDRGHSTTLHCQQHLLLPLCCGAANSQLTA
jgi:hypothetical protein